MDLKKELDQMSNTLFEIESELNNPEYDYLQQKYAIKKAFRKKNLTDKARLLLNIVLKKMGRIPEYPIEQYRTDIVIRRKIQELKNNLALLECSQKKISEISIDEFHDTIVVKKEEMKSLETLKKGYIAIVIESLDKGGMEQVVALLASGFHQRGISVKVLCLNKGGAIAEQLRNLGIEICEFYNNGRKFTKYIKDNPPILVNTHYVKKHIKFLYNKNIPVVEVVHNMYVYYCDHVARVERKNEKYYTKLIAVSQLVRDTYMERIKPSDKIAVIENAAVMREAPQRNRAEVRQALGIPVEGFVLLNIGSIDRRKNQLGIVTAFDIVTQIIDMPVYLVLAGNVQDKEYNEKVLEAINQCDRKDQIIVLPYYYSRVRELYKMADIFVLDSYYEGWSIAATEALYDGLPIIHSMCGSAKELIQDGRYGIIVSNPAGKLDELSNEDIIRKINRFEFDNTQEIASAIIKMLKCNTEWKSKKRLIAKEASELFSIRVMIEKYLEVFNDLN